MYLNEDFTRCKLDTRIFYTYLECYIFIDYVSPVKAIRPMPYMGGLASMGQLMQNKAVSDAQIQLLRTQATKAASETAGQEIENRYSAERYDVSIDNTVMDTNLKSAQYESMYAQSDFDIAFKNLIDSYEETGNIDYGALRKVGMYALKSFLSNGYNNLTRGGLKFNRYTNNYEHTTAIQNNTGEGNGRTRFRRRSSTHSGGSFRWKKH